MLNEIIKNMLTSAKSKCSLQIETADMWPPRFGGRGCVHLVGAELSPERGHPFHCGVAQSIVSVPKSSEKCRVSGRELLN